MITKLLIYSTFIFLILGFWSSDSILFFFFAIHSFMLSLGLLLRKSELNKTKEIKAQLTAMGEAEAGT